MNEFLELGINEESTKLEITKAYKNLVKKYHLNNNIDKDTNKKIIEINKAYEELIEKIKYNNIINEDNGYCDDKILSSDIDNKYLENEQKEVRTPKSDISNYIKKHKNQITRINSNGKFICTPKLYTNEYIRTNEYIFVDGYTEVTTSREYTLDFGSGLFGPAYEYYYNYIDENGDFLFDNSYSILIYYIGRGLFLTNNCDYVWHILNMEGKKEFIPYFRGMKNPLDKETFISNIVNELNIKYESESNGEKYKISKHGINYNGWREKSWMYPMGQNLKKTVNHFVKAISDFDESNKSLPKRKRISLIKPKSNLTSCINE